MHLAKKGDPLDKGDGDFPIEEGRVIFLMEYRREDVRFGIHLH